MRWTMWTALLAVSGCVIAVDGDAVINQPFDAAEVRLSHGDLTVRADRGPATIEVDFGGLGNSDVGWQVVDGVLLVDYECGGANLCGGSLDLTVPARTHLTVELNSGDLSIEEMAGRIDAAVGAGSADLSDLRSPRVLAITGAGEVKAEFDERPQLVELITGTGAIDLQVPAGPYAVDADVGAGRLEIDGITEDPQADATLVVVTQAGDVEIRGD